MRLWRIGAGHVLLMGTSAVFYAVSAQALIAGGPGLLATLVVASSLFQFALAARLQLLRRLFTPTVTGTVVMLIAVSVMPIVFDMLNQIPGGRRAGRRAAGVRRLARRDGSVRAASFRGLEAVGAGGRRGRGSDRLHAARALRPEQRGGGALVRPAGRLAGLRLLVRTVVLGAAAGVRAGDRHRRRRDDRRCRGDPARLLAAPAGSGLPGGPGRGGRRRRRQPAVGPLRHGAQHDLLDQRLHHRADRHRLAAGGRVASAPSS